MNNFIDSMTTDESFCLKDASQMTNTKLCMNQKKFIQASSCLEKKEKSKVYLYVLLPQKVVKDELRAYVGALASCGELLGECICTWSLR